MKPEYIVYALTFLSAVVVVLTRIRLSQAQAAGQHQVGMGTVNAATVRHFRKPRAGVAAD